MCRAESSSTCPDPCRASSVAAFVIVTPCWPSRFAMVRISARSGRLAKTSGSAVKRLAAISGRAAFLAPPIGIVPVSGVPPRIRMRSMTSAPDAGCFYGREGRGSSRRVVFRLAHGGFGQGLLLGARLLLAAMQVLAQGACEPRLAFGMLLALGRLRIERIGHRPDGRRARGGCQSLLDAQADLGGEDDRNRLLRGIFRRLVRMGTAPCFDSGAIAIDRGKPGPPRFVERLKYGRCGGVRHRINRRAAPHHYSLRCRKTESVIAANCLFHSMRGQKRQVSASLLPIVGKPTCPPTLGRRADCS